MQYLLLVYTNESTNPPPGSTEEEVMWVAHEEYSRQMHSSMLESRALHPSDTATTVRMRNGATLTSDGPIAAAQEQLAGFYLIEADNLDDAIDAASRVPCAEYAAVEVRPVVDISGNVA